MTDALAAEGLTKKYGRRTALLDCTLSVPAGRVVGLVGPNGAGKSTLIRAIAGLVRYTGTVLVDQRVALTLKSRELPSLIVFVPQ